MKLDPDVAYNVMIPFSVALPTDRLNEIKNKYKCSKTTHL
jgi:hypothetical protein